MYIDIRSKIKIIVLLVLIVTTYFFGASIIDSNIDEIRSKKLNIENINQNVSILVLVSNRMYGLDDQITSKLLKNREFKNESNQISIFKDGFINFSNADKHKIDSLIDLKFENIRSYKEDSLLCGDADRYLVENMSINTEIRKILKKSIGESLKQNDEKLKLVLQEYDLNYKKYILNGALIIFIFFALGFLLVNDLSKIVRSHDRYKSTIDDLLLYIKSIRK